MRCRSGTRRVALETSPVMMTASDPASRNVEWNASTAGGVARSRWQSVIQASFTPGSYLLRRVVSELQGEGSGLAESGVIRQIVALSGVPCGTRIRQDLERFITS